MTKKTIVFFLMSALIIASGCCPFGKKCSSDKPAKGKPGAAEIITLNELNNGEIIDIKVGNNIAINLEANPSTGYRWTIVENDEEILPLVSRDFKQNEAAESMVGVGGTLTLTFKAIKGGQTKLRLEYSKQLASEDDTVQYFEIVVTVK